MNYLFTYCGSDFIIPPEKKNVNIPQKKSSSIAHEHRYLRQENGENRLQAAVCYMGRVGAALRTDTCLSYAPNRPVTSSPEG